MSFTNAVTPTESCPSQCNLHAFIDHQGVSSMPLGEKQIIKVLGHKDYYVLVPQHSAYGPTLVM